MISGSRAGQTDILGQSQITIGRHPQAVLRFDPDQDLDVSSQHAVVTLVRDTWVLRDLGSTNGTFVNGDRAAVADAPRHSCAYHFTPLRPRRLKIRPEPAAPDKP